MKNLFLAVLLLIIAYGLYSLGIGLKQNNGGTRACTEEALICPDGTAVGRTGPNCEFAPCPNLGQTTRAINVGETRFINGLSITLHEVVNDYRCPIDVTCIQGGAINARVTFKSNTDTETFNMPSDEAPRQFDNFTVSIVGVAPDARSTITINPEDYIVTFEVKENSL